MSALDELSIPAPRPDPLCRRYARKMDPWWGFVLAGVIWFACAMSMVTLAGIKLTSALGYADGSPETRRLSLIVEVAGLAATIGLFVWWRRRRLATKETLVREGDLVEVTVTGRPLQLSKTRTVVDFDGDDRELRCVFNRWFLPRTGETVTILHHPRVPHLVAFGSSGGMFSGHVRSGRVA
jgi:hypothetical protein